jgi:hypothetical protein
MEMIKIKIQAALALSLIGSITVETIWPRHRLQPHILEARVLPSLPDLSASPPAITEDYWFNPITPQATAYQRSYLPGPDDITAGIMR